MKKAFEAVQTKTMGFSLGSKTFCVPKATRIRMCQSKTKTSDLLTKPLGHNPALSKDIKNDLVKYFKEMEVRYWGLTR